MVRRSSGNSWSNCLTSRTPPFELQLLTLLSVLSSLNLSGPMPVRHASPFLVSESLVRPFFAPFNSVAWQSLTQPQPPPAKTHEVSHWTGTMFLSRCTSTEEGAGVQLLLEEGKWDIPLLQSPDSDFFLIILLVFSFLYIHLHFLLHLILEIGQLCVEMDFDPRFDHNGSRQSRPIPIPDVPPVRTYLAIHTRLWLRFH